MTCTRAITFDNSRLALFCSWEVWNERRDTQEFVVLLQQAETRPRVSGCSPNARHHCAWSSGSSYFLFEWSTFWKLAWYSCVLGKILAFLSFHSAHGFGMGRVVVYAHQAPSVRYPSWTGSIIIYGPQCERKTERVCKFVALNENLIPFNSPVLVSIVGVLNLIIRGYWSFNSWIWIFFICFSSPSSCRSSATFDLPLIFRRWLNIRQMATYLLTVITDFQ